MVGSGWVGRIYLFKSQQTYLRDPVQVIPVQSLDRSNDVASEQIPDEDEDERDTFDQLAEDMRGQFSFVHSCVDLSLKEFVIFLAFLWMTLSLNFQFEKDSLFGLDLY
ncbi:uncharacterized protein LOC136035601 [Artemia franciscana]|uniref:uncharacterized protein LOC136035601 n=1 Tax=Artemia franciscana TaxID=6661 RepID=UPI0032DA0E5D